MRSKSKPIGDQKQLNLFDSVDQASCNPPSMANSPDTQHEIGATERQPGVKAYANPNKHSIRRKMLSYKEWRSIVVEYMRDYWRVELKEAMEGWNVVDEDMLRAAHKEGIPPKVFVNDLAYECEWINIGPTRSP